MRDGFSTSACAAAAACAAIHGLNRGVAPAEVAIRLPKKDNVCFVVSFMERSEGAYTCGVIKDSGDDPDVTNGIEIRVSATRGLSMETRIFGGEGVGVVTLPGLPVEVSEPAINPGSRKLISEAVAAYCALHELPGTYDLTITVPEGEAIARETMNPKLGIEGGISILGTDGIVHAYSIPAYRASIAVSLKFALENGFSSVALVTGKRSEDYIVRDFPTTYAINVGDELAFPLAQLHRYPFTEVILGGMIGKMAKVAQGRFSTHVDQGGVDFGLLAEIASAKGASSAALQAIHFAVTGHQVQKLLAPEQIFIEPEIAFRAATQVSGSLNGLKTVEVRIYSLAGELLGNARLEKEA